MKGSRRRRQRRRGGANCNGLKMLVARTGQYSGIIQESTPHYNDEEEEEKDKKDGEKRSQYGVNELIIRLPPFNALDSCQHIPPLLPPSPLSLSLLTHTTHLYTLTPSTSISSPPFPFLIKIHQLLMTRNKSLSRGSSFINKD